MKSGARTIRYDSARGKIAAMQTQLHHEHASNVLATDTSSGTAQMERLRVLHVISRLGMGGTEHGVLKVMRGLGEQEFEHRICAVRGIDQDFASRMHVDAQAYAGGKFKTWIPISHSFAWPVS